MIVIIIRLEFNNIQVTDNFSRDLITKLNETKFYDSTGLLQISPFAQVLIVFFVAFSFF